MTRKQLVGYLGLIGALGLPVAGLLIGAPSAETNTPPAFQQMQNAEPPETSASIGTYQPQAAFEAYPPREEMLKNMQQIQVQMQEAQQAQDAERTAALQQQAQQMQNATINRFYKDVERVLPDIAEESNLEVIALQVVYRDPGVAVQDVTAEVAEALQADEAASGERPVVPYPQNQQNPRQ